VRRLSLQFLKEKIKEYTFILFNFSSKKGECTTSKNEKLQYKELHYMPVILKKNRVILRKHIRIPYWVRKGN
jgi:2-iminoacetate synthase ThiH